MLSSTPTGLVVSIPTWSRTRTKTLGESCAIRYTIGMALAKSRRLDLHQHQPVYKTGALLRRATSASSTSARSRTSCGSFGGCLLSQEHTRRRVSEGSRTLTFWFTARRAETATPRTPSMRAAAIRKCDGPRLQSRYSMRVNELTVRVGSGSLFWTTRCQV